MQCVPEFVEGRADLVDGQETDRIARLGEIAYIYHDRAYIIAGGIHILLPEVGHPRSAPLGAAGKIIRHEPAEKRAVRIGDLEGLDLRMIYGNIVRRLYLYAVETLGGLEHSGAHIVKLEILAHLGFVEGVLRLAHLLGIEPPVPRLNSAAFRKKAGLRVLVHEYLHVSHFLPGLGDSLLHYPGKEGIHCGVVVSHLVLEDAVGRAIETEHCGLFGPELHDFEKNGLVVILIAIVAS